MATISEAILLAFDLHTAGRLDEAESLYGRVLDADPDQPDALHLSGILLGQTGRAEEGIARIAQAIARRPGSAEFHTNLGGLLRVANRPDEAVAAFRKAHALGGESAADPLFDLLRERGGRCLAAGDPAGAEEAYGEALRLRPGDAGVLDGLAAARFDRGAWDAALAAFRRQMEQAPHAHQPLYNAGLAACNAGLMGEAATLFGRAAAVAPGHLDTHEYLVATLYHANRVEEAARAAGAILARKARDARGANGAGVELPSAAAPEGRTRRIIAFSLWGNAPLYTQGALENVRLAAEFYPGWTCRIYHDDSVPAPVLAALAAAGAELVAMEPGSGPVHGLFWRFLVSDEPAVSHFLCRDADSRLNSRERAAVDNWLASGRPFHVMRDHIMHTDLMLAGLWGGRAGVLPPMAPLIRDAVRAEDGRVKDQRFLGRVVWPLIEGRCLVHDSAHPGHGEPFPNVPIDPRFAFTHVGACVKSV